jgi:hypothetical protein
MDARQYLKRHRTVGRDEPQPEPAVPKARQRLHQPHSALGGTEPKVSQVSLSAEQRDKQLGTVTELDDVIGVPRSRNDASQRHAIR